MAATLHLGLLVGINYAGSDSALSGCVNDVYNVQNMLCRKLKWRQSEINVLTEKQATRQNILVALKQLVQSANSLLSLHPENRVDVWFHYSGHGSQIISRSPGERDGKDETIVPYDYMKAGQITDSDLAIILSHLDSRAHFTCVFDCCHSGTILDLPYLVESKSCVFKVDRPFQKSHWSSNSNVVCLSGCRDTQTSADYDGAGAMTTAILRVLDDHNYSLSVQQLMSDLQSTLKGDVLIKGGFTQIAQLSANQQISPDAWFMCGESGVRDVIVSSAH